jgi:hypothetical protein
VIEDDAEKKIPKLGLIEFQDAETGELVEIDTSSRLFRAKYDLHYKELALARDSQLTKSKIDQVRVDTSHSFVDPLIRFFASRHQR